VKEWGVKGGRLFGYLEKRGSMSSRYFEMGEAVRRLLLLRGLSGLSISWRSWR